MPRNRYTTMPRCLASGSPGTSRPAVKSQSTIHTVLTPSATLAHVPDETSRPVRAFIVGSLVRRAALRGDRARVRTARSSPQEGQNRYETLPRARHRPGLRHVDVDQRLLPRSLLSRVVVTSIGKGAIRRWACRPRPPSACSVARGEHFLHCSYVIGRRGYRQRQVWGAFAILLFRPGDSACARRGQQLQRHLQRHQHHGESEHYRGAGTLPADISTRITPEPGTKLVIVDFPNRRRPSTTSPSAHPQLRTARRCPPVRLKALFAGRVGALAKPSSCPCCRANRTSPVFHHHPAPEQHLSRT